VTPVDLGRKRGVKSPLPASVRLCYPPPFLRPALTNLPGRCLESFRMTRVIEWMISLLIVVVLFVMIGLFLPAKRSVSHEIETNRPMSTVTDLLGSFTRFKDWNALINHDPRMQLTISGPESGEGAKLEFASTSPQIGRGSWELVEVIPGERLVYALDTPGSGTKKRMTFTFERTGQRNQNVKITQRYSVDYGWNLFGRYAGLYVTDNVGDDIRRGLGKLSNLLATIPRFDYSAHDGGFAVQDMPAQNVLLANANAKRANDEIAVAMTNQIKWIERVMEENNLERAGPTRIVTNEFSTDTYNFDVIVPIRRKGTGPATPADGEGDDAATAGEGDAAADAAAAAPAPTPAVPAVPGELERFDLKLTGEGNPVIYAQTPAHRVATTTYIGPSPGLARVRDLVRAWAIVKGSETYARPYEDYLVDIKNMLMDDAEFRVYWPIRTPGEVTAEIVQILPAPQEEGAPPPELPAQATDGSAGAPGADDPAPEPAAEPAGT
jgi:hypothetical protein